MSQNLSSLEKAQNLIDKMEYDVKDAVYRLLWQEHVKEDVVTQFEEDERYESMSEENIEALADQCSHRFCFDGDYDCNLDHWSNIQNLIDEEINNYLEEDQGKE